MYLFVFLVVWIEVRTCACQAGSYATEQNLQPSNINPWASILCKRTCTFFTTYFTHINYLQIVWLWESFEFYYYNILVHSNSWTTLDCAYSLFSKVSRVGFTKLKETSYFCNEVTKYLSLTKIFNWGKEIKYFQIHQLHGIKNLTYNIFKKEEFKGKSIFAFIIIHERQITFARIKWILLKIF